MLQKLQIQFENPKPYLFSKFILSCFTNEGDLILDSFAGSGTTGHAVFELNSEITLDRNFILVEIDKETCRNKTYKRLRSVISKDSSGNHKNSFSYVELGHTLFNAEGQISDEVSYNDLARHIYFCETGDPLPKTKKDKSPFLGIHKGIGIYLLYNGIIKDKKVDGGNVLTSKILAKLPTFEGKKVIYGTACRFSDKKLRSENIIFKQTPYEIRIS